MGTTKLLLATFIFLLGFTSCSRSDNGDQKVEENPLADYNLLSTFTANGHDLEIYSEEGQFTIGYNELFIRIKDEAADTYVRNADILWKPLMHMTGMMHACPASALKTTSDTSVYSGYLVFQMPGNTDEYWDLTFDYNIGGQDFSTSERIEVNSPADGKRRVNSFMGSDDARYILAMMPIKPKEGVNDFSAVLFKMENMMDFPVAQNYRIKVDPRMPGMGNHTSPNNADLTFDVPTGIYKGKLNFTMTGYWKISLKLENESGVLIKGEDITGENESSNLYFEIEF